MYKQTLLCGLLVCFTTSLHAAAYEEESNYELPHLDLEMTSYEYRELTAVFLENKGDDPLNPILDAGQRNLDWIEWINQSRADGDKLELSSEETQPSIPIEQASFSSRTLIMNEWQELLDTMPEAMRAVLLDWEELTRDPPLPDEQFLNYAKALDRTYQRASRWLLLEPKLRRYAAAAYKDVRGFYYLRNETNLEQKLRGWDALAAMERQRLSGYLVSLCVNSRESVDFCRDQLATALLRDRQAWSFYSEYFPSGKEVWDAFFEIPRRRTDIVWSRSNPDVMRIPFLDPRRSDVTSWLRENIQDEWHWVGWNLILDFRATGSITMTHVVFKDGATPHVNSIAGSEITMDGNRSLNEYASRWTIRHEYGHVLGIPDCYVEFYDEAAGVMVAYQLDTTDLMCSRRGRMKERHYEQLKEAYFR